MRISLFLALAVLVSACDTTPGVPPSDLHPPGVSDLSYTPQKVALEDVPLEEIVGDTVRVALAVSVHAQDMDDDLDVVRFTVRSPVPNTEPVASGELTPGADGAFSTATTISLEKSLVGLYTVTVLASDKSGMLSNEVRGALQYDAAGSPPVIDDVELPERVQRPAPGAAPLRLPVVAVVSDPDGLANIASVQMQSVPAGSSTPILLCDDGGFGSCNPGFSASGDAEENDGRFTVTLQLDAASATGTFTFAFTARDRSGLESEPVTRSIIIE